MVERGRTSRSPISISAPSVPPLPSTRGSGVAELRADRLAVEPTIDDQAGTGISDALDAIAILGLGYVGLPTALGLFAAGKSVIGIDLSQRRLDSIDAGRVDLVARDREVLVEAQADARFHLTADPGEMAGADVVLICVPTPVDRHLVPDLTLLRNACSTVVHHARPSQLVVLTSTSYVGTTRAELIRPLERRGFAVGEDVNVAFSPERIDPGNHRPHQVVPRVVGGAADSCTERAAQLFGSISGQVHSVSSPEAAELTKLYENTFRAVNIALANELADICKVLDVDVMETIDAAATKPYGFMPFFPGPGVGGHCIPCDPHYLRWQLRARRGRSPLIDEAMSCISHRPRRVIERAAEMLADQHQPLRGAKVLVYGVAYKPGVEDVRESPALEILEELIDKGTEVAYHDPLIPTLAVDDQILTSVAELDQEWDLVIAHTVHTTADALWLTDQPAVLDASYRLAQRVGMETV